MWEKWCLCNISILFPLHSTCSQIYVIYVWKSLYKSCGSSGWFKAFSAAAPLSFHIWFLFTQIISWFTNYWKTISLKYFICNSSTPLLCFKKIIEMSWLFSNIFEDENKHNSNLFCLESILSHFCKILFPKKLFRLDFLWVGEN